MRSFLKYVSFITLFLFVVFSNSSVFALDNETDLVSIDDKANLTVGDLSFKNVSFINNTFTSSNSLGISGQITSNSEEETFYKIILTFYNEDEIQIGDYSKKYSIKDSGDRAFAHMAARSLIDGQPMDIKYYKISVVIDEYPEEIIESNITPSKNHLYSSEDYVIDKYDVNIIVNKNNTYDITETITAYFNVPRHGIVRDIPIKNKLIRLDGNLSTNKAEISGLNVNKPYSVTKDRNTFSLKIGEEDETIIGEQEYIIKYTYDIGADPLKGIDELYLNIIGDKWDTAIGNITFSISMPDRFNQTLLGFSSGSYRSTSNDLVDYYVEDNKIIGKYNGILESYSALTVRCELEEGYFEGARNTFNIANYLLIIIPILFVIITIVLWYIYGRDDLVVSTVEFYPPEGLSAIDVAYIYRGIVRNQDVTSVLIALANKGYIKIEELNNSFFKKDFRITKLKEYDGNVSSERTFMRGLFGYNKNKNEVKLSELKYKFYETRDSIISTACSKINKDKIFDKANNSKVRLVKLFIAITYVLGVLPLALLEDDVSAVCTSFAFHLILMLPMYVIIKTIKRNGWNSNIFWTIFFIAIAYKITEFLWIAPFLPDEVEYYIMTYRICFIAVVIMLIFLPLLRKRTEYGRDMLGKIRGFRRFLITAHKDKLEAMVNDDPTYFYDILPYTYVLGVSTLWIRHFESITLNPPSWYENNGTFNVYSFSSFVNSAMSTTGRVMSSTPSSSSDSSSSGGSSFSGSSGGGSSGGGSGGGGGSSW